MRQFALEVSEISRCFWRIHGCVIFIVEAAPLGGFVQKLIIFLNFFRGNTVSRSREFLGSIQLRRFDRLIVRIHPGGRHKGGE